MSSVQRFYDESAEREWERLNRHRTEFAVTMRALAEHLPRVEVGSEQAILDVGGGPGRYAVALARQGYRVTLFDLSRPLLDFAANRAEEAGVELTDYVHGDATDLGRFADASFDVVLLMGPLYHLLEEAGRRRAAEEGRRVLKPGGLLFASFISRYSPIRDVAKFEPEWLVEHRADAEDVLTRGRLIAPTGFCDAYFAHPADIVPFMRGCGFAPKDLVACEGVVSMIEEKVNELSGSAWEAWVDLNYRLGKDPCLHGGAEHLLYVGRKL